MTKDEAIDLAADWWVSMIKSGHWDNHDAQSEAMISFTRSHIFKPTEEDFVKLKLGFVELLQEGPHFRSLYSDYGNNYIDQMLKKIGITVDSMIICPQKAGTEIQQKGDGWIVKAKSGYGKEYLEISRNG